MWVGGTVDNEAPKPGLIERMALRHRARVYVRLIVPWLAQPRRIIMAEVPAGSRVLDIACGTGELVLALAPSCAEAVGVDLDPAKIDYACGREGADERFTVADATSLPFEDGRFDVTTLSMALHGLAVDARQQALTEALRVAPRVLALDYATPLPSNPTAWLLRLIERGSPTEHHAGFVSFLALGGMEPLAASCGAEANRVGSALSGCVELWTVRSS